MDAELRKKVLTEWQNKKKETLTHPYLKEKVEWGGYPMYRPCSLQDIFVEIWMDILCFYGNEVERCWY